MSRHRPFSHASECKDSDYFAQYKRNKEKSFDYCNMTRLVPVIH